MRTRLLSVAACCLLAWAGQGTGQAAAQEARSCTVTALIGQNGRMGQEGAWQPIAAGPLPAGATLIETGAATRLEVTCLDGFVVTIGPNSRCDLGDLVAPDDRSIVMALLEGIIGVVTPDRGGSVQVRTPAAIAAVRSTAWLMEHDDDAGATAVFVREGRVAVSNSATSVVLAEGEGITLTSDAVLRPVAEWGQPRIEQATGALGLGWD